MLSVIEPRYFFFPCMLVIILFAFVFDPLIDDDFSVVAVNNIHRSNR